MEIWLMVGRETISQFISKCRDLILNLNVIPKLSIWKEFLNAASEIFVTEIRSRKWTSITKSPQTLGGFFVLVWQSSSVLIARKIVPSIWAFELIHWRGCSIRNNFCKHHHFGFCYENRISLFRSRFEEPAGFHNTTKGFKIVYRDLWNFEH